jgi:hypothetical protein
MKPTIAVDDQALMTPEEAAVFRRVKVNTLAKERMSGFGPKYIKLRHRVFYRRCDLIAWIEQRIICSTSQKPAAECAEIGERAA